MALKSTKHIGLTRWWPWPSVYFAYDRLGNVEKVRDAVGDRTFYYTDESEPGTDRRLHKESIVSSNSPT